ncbi:MAG: hypothetical protein AAB639_00505 [Patescibacteria group bacterium]
MKSLKTDLFVLCDYATVSREQKLSTIGIFDQFFVANIPTNWPKMFLVAVLSGQAGEEYPVTLSITPPGPTEQKFPDKELKVTLGPNGRANLITELVNFPLPLAGIYKVEIKSGKDQVAQLEFKVTKTTATYAGGQDLQGKKIPN